AYGHGRDDDARAAFGTGIAALGKALEPPAGEFTSWRNLGRVDAALTRLRRLGPQDKRRVLAAVLATIRHDREIGIAEHELFRTVAAVLDCPVPPVAGPGTLRRAHP